MLTGAFISILKKNQRCILAYIFLYLSAS